MTTNPALKVYVANGYFDLATPFLASEYTFTHLGLDKSLQDNITMAYYGAGHMMYVDMDELKKDEKRIWMRILMLRFLIYNVRKDANEINLS